MVSPAINVQNMQGAPKSPGIAIQQQQPQVRSVHYCLCQTLC